MKNQRIFKQSDAVLLSRLAEQLLRLGDVQCNAGEELLDIISTARIVPDDIDCRDHVSLHSIVRYELANTNDCKTIVIVCPHQADTQSGRISVMTPVGLALIGRKVSQVVDVRLPANRTERIKVIAITHEAQIDEEHAL